MLQSPFDKAQFLQDILDVFNVITIYITIPIPANKCMHYSKQKCSIPFFISAIFLWSNAVCFCRTISLWNIKCSFKRYTMPFGGVQCAFKTRFPLKGSSGWMGSWARRAQRAPKELEFGNAFGARARAARPGPLSPRGPLSKENALISTCLTFLSKEQYPF